MLPATTIVASKVLKKICFTFDCSDIRGLFYELKHGLVYDIIHDDVVRNIMFNGAYQEECEM